MTSLFPLAVEGIGCPLPSRYFTYRHWNLAHSFLINWNGFAKLDKQVQRSGAWPVRREHGFDCRGGAVRHSRRQLLHP
jgi:hypothetical protein